MAPRSWIAVHTGVADSPLVGRAVQDLGITTAEAVGLLVNLWSKLRDADRDGSVTGVNSVTLEQWSAYRPANGKWAAFILANHVDRNGRIKGWDDWQGAEARERQYNRERQRRFRERHKRNGHALAERDSVTVTDALAVTATDRQTDRQTESPLNPPLREPSSTAEAPLVPKRATDLTAGVLAGWQQRRDRAARDAELSASIRRKIAEHGPTPQTFPTNKWSVFSDEEREAISRLGGLQAIYVGLTA